MISTPLAIPLKELTLEDGTDQAAPYIWDRMARSSQKEEFLEELFEAYPDLVQGEMSEYKTDQGRAELAATLFDDLPLILHLYIRLGYDMINGRFSVVLLQRKIKAVRASV